MNRSRNKSYVMSASAIQVGLTPRDAELYERDGYLAEPEVQVDVSGYVVTEIDNDTHQIRRVGLVSDKDDLPKMLKDLKRRPHNFPIRPSDIVTFGDIHKRFRHRSKSTTHYWIGRTNFPEPIGQVGESKLWSWSEIQRWFADRGKVTKRGRPRK